ncbi:hypothetical protein [Streptomyces sp. NPDC059957]|uniref:hypothetical protein n=1 Tax=Streptomyces sp. NPDC059957 TaxID=3347016 RepID=UPI003653FD24
MSVLENAIRRLRNGSDGGISFTEHPGEIDLVIHGDVLHINDSGGRKAVCPTEEFITQGMQFASTALRYVTENNPSLERNEYVQNLSKLIGEHY